MLDYNGSILTKDCVGQNIVRCQIKQKPVHNVNNHYVKSS